MTKSVKRTPSAASSSVLSKDTVLAHLAAHPGDTKRDLARAFGVRGATRQELKRILKELADEGVIERGKKKFARPGSLPPVMVLEITGADPDGDLFARPTHWERKEAPPVVLVVPGRDDTGTALGRGERILAHITQTPEGYEGRVIKRLGASAHRVLGVVRRIGNTARIDPIDRKTRYAYVIDLAALDGIADGELVVVEPVSGQPGARSAPHGRIVERLGSMNQPKAVSLIAIHAHGIPTEFPREAIDQAERARPLDPQRALRGNFSKWAASPPERAKRVDLRDVPLVTVDPEDARDHDDAVWAGPDPDAKNRGGHIVIVAIADVAHYVTPGSALDREAKKRGNSVYFPDRVVPMLPEALSADLCSLRQGEDRPCLAVRMVFDKNGRKRRHEFAQAIMRSAANFTYAQLQSAFDGTPGGIAPPLRDAMRSLWDAYRSLARARDERAPLDLDLPERRIVIGADGKIQSIDFRERMESMRLIEEFMIQANVCAAESLEKARIPLPYRVHERPGQEKIGAFADYLRSIGFSFAKGQIVKPAVFNRILALSKGTPHEEVMNDVILRTQTQAVYAPENVGHFGLNLTRYAHFTSPIRRYADLVVHRALIRALDLRSGGVPEDEMAHLTETAEHISMTERRAMAAERDSVDRYIAAFMEDRIGARFDARITGVTRFGLFVRLAQTGADGLLPMRALGAEFFRHDAKRHALVGEHSRTAYRLGDRIAVRLAEAAPLTGGLRFELAEEPAVPGTKRRAPARRRPR